MLLLRILTLAAVLALPACGGGSSSNAAALQLQKSADAAVAGGLAGVALEHLTADGSTQVLAGLRQVGSTDKIQAGDAFMIGSITKAMTSALAGRLVEQGRIAWTTTLAEALPDLAAGMLPAYRGVTLEQLLAHRGGVLGFNDGEDSARLLAYLQSYSGTLPGTQAGRERFFAAWLLVQPPAAQPGQDFHYSNAGYALAALMLEVRTGRTYADLFEQELARPLGITVSWTLADTRFANRPVGHGGAKGQLSTVTPEDGDVAQWLALLQPGGVGTTMTPDSYATWVNWHLRALRGETTPLSASYLRRIQSLVRGEYALGWIAGDLDGRPVLAHDGEWRGFSTEVIVDLKGRSASFGFTNTEADDGSWALTVLNQALLDIERALPPQ